MNFYMNDMEGSTVKRLMKTLLCILLICVLALQLAACAASPTAPTGSGTTAEPAKQEAGLVDLMAEVKPAAAELGEKPSQEAAAAATDFSLRLFRAANEADKNTLLSPLSVLCALAMTANGAKGETLTQMEQTLGLSRDELNLFFRGYLDALAGDKVLKPANSVWFTTHERFTVNGDFLQTNADYYGAAVYRAPFDNATLKAINDWVRDKTDGMIPEILDKIPPEAVMYLVNALAFDAKWEEPYESYSVSSGNFTLQNGETRLADFMYAEEREYLENELAVGFVKPYEGGKYAFAALLPREGVSLEELLAGLDGAALQDLLRNRSDKTVFTSLPKFETEYGAELSGVLQAMGMELAFDGNRADFTGLGTSTGGNIYISRVIHKTFISVAEEGTRAGAATVVEMTDGAMFVEDPKVVYLDRPFVYLLIDTETCLPLFIGTMTDPG
jgi:serpin B